MEFKPFTLLILAAAVTVSGCIDPGSGSSIAGEDRVEWVSCEDIQIRIDQASETAMIRQMNPEPVGEVELEWRFENGEEASRAVNLSERGNVEFVQSDVSGTVEELEVIPDRCPGRSFSSE